MDRGPLLTSAIIFYLAIGAAIFEVLEEPHWKEAKKNYYTQKLHLLKEFPCLGQEGLDKILQVSRRLCPYRHWKPAGALGVPKGNPSQLWITLSPCGQPWGWQERLSHMGLAAEVCRLPVDTGVTHARRLFGNPVCPERRWG